MDKPTGPKRARNQFRAWLIWQLNQRGEKLPPNPKYVDLVAAIERRLLNPERDAA